MNVREAERSEGAPPGARSARERIGQLFADGSRDPRWFAMNVFSRFSCVRRGLRRLSRPVDLGGYDPQRSRFPDLDIDHAVAELERDGVSTGLQLPDDLVAHFVDFASTRSMRGEGEYHWGFSLDEKQRAEEEVGRRFGFGNFLHLDADLPAIAELGQDPALLEIASRYFRARPLHVISRLWWNFVVPPDAPGAADVRRIASYFHHDKDGFAGLRLFFYLTDVDAESGPHVVVRGSHRHKSVRQVLSIAKRTDAAIAGYYGDEKLVPITGPAGSGFFEDPFCFHKGTAPLRNDRLILELQYATTRYAVFDHDPDRSELSEILRPAWALPAAA